MGLEGINLFSVGGFTFFLLIIAVGYYTIEVVLGKYYPFRYIFREYSNNLFDRALHYVIWGMSINIFFIFFFAQTKDLDMLAKTFNIIGKTAEAFAVGGLDVNSLQLIIFGCYYFFILVTLLSVFAFGMHILPRLSEKLASLYEGKVSASDAVKVKK